MNKKTAYRCDFCGKVYGTPDDDSFRRGQYNTYESALSAGIDAVLKLLTEEI